jgi:thioredoxin reductase
MRELDVVVIGAGPGGLQLGYHLQKLGLSYTILERSNCCGSFFQTFPVHRTLISINKVNTGIDHSEVNMRWDWNSLCNDGQELSFGGYTESYFPSADTLVKYLGDFRERFGIDVTFDAEVKTLTRNQADDRIYEVKTNKGVFCARHVVVATGLSKQNMPKVEGINYAIPYGELRQDRDRFKNKRILIIGKGNSAFETADDLSETASVIHMCSPNPVVLAWNTHYVGHVRAVNNNVLDTYQLKSQNTILDGNIEAIRRVGNQLEVDISYSHARGQKIVVPVDYVINCAGFSMDTSIFSEECMPEMHYNGKYPLLNEKWESASQSNMYFCGTVMHSLDYKKTFSGFIHGFRYNCAVLSRILHQAVNGESFPAKKVPEVHALYEIIMDRIHTSSSLFQQPGFMCDAVQLMSEDGTLRPDQYFEDVTFDLIRGGNVLDTTEAYLTLSIEYGKEKYVDVFNIPRNPENGSESAFIHPVLRLFRRGKQVQEFHLPEDLENNWYQDLYQSSLAEFMADIFDCHGRGFSKAPQPKFMANLTRVQECSE